jgi:hypothetical protein
MLKCFLLEWAFHFSKCPRPFAGEEENKYIRKFLFWVQFFEFGSLQEIKGGSSIGRGVALAMVKEQKYICTYLIWMVGR